MKNVSRTFAGMFGMAAGFIIGAVLNGLENRSNKVEPIKYQQYHPTVNELAKTDDVLFDGFDDVLYVLGQMDNTIINYGYVSVADFFDIVGVTPDFIDSKYGWYTINSAYIDKQSEVYILRLPKPVALNK